MMSSDLGLITLQRCIEFICNLSFIKTIEIRGCSEWNIVDNADEYIFGGLKTYCLIICYQLTKFIKSSILSQLTLESKLKKFTTKTLSLKQYVKYHIYRNHEKLKWLILLQNSHTNHWLDKNNFPLTYSNKCSVSAMFIYTHAFPK